MIRFHSHVRLIERTKNQWKITITGESVPYVVDAVAVCSGHFSTPYIPRHITGLQHCATMIHAKAYRTPEAYHHKVRTFPTLNSVHLLLLEGIDCGLRRIWPRHCT